MNHNYTPHVPGGRKPIEPKKKAIAIAVTGGPSNRPIDVVFPIPWDIDAVAQIAATFPHKSFFWMRGRDSDIGEDRYIVTALGLYVFTPDFIYFF